MSLGTSNRDGGKTSESGHLRALGKIVSGDVIAGLNAVQRAAGVNMSVDVQVGDAFVRRSDGTYAHPVFNDAVYNQVISAADGSNPRRDIVVIYVDYGQTPSTAVSNNTNGVVKIKVVNGTPAGSPVDPNGAAIQASVGSGNPYSILARVRVPAGQTSISNSLIDDLRTMIYSNANTINTAALIGAAVTTAKLLDANVTKAKLATNSLASSKIDQSDWMNYGLFYDFRTSGNQTSTSSAKVILATNIGNVFLTQVTKTGRVKVRCSVPIGNSSNNMQLHISHNGSTFVEIANFSKNDSTYVYSEGIITGLTPGTSYTFGLYMTVDGGATATLYAFRKLNFAVEDY